MIRKKRRERNHKLHIETKTKFDERRWQYKTYYIFIVLTCTSVDEQLPLWASTGNTQMYNLDYAAISNFCFDDCSLVFENQVPFFSSFLWKKPEDNNQRLIYFIFSFFHN